MYGHCLGLLLPLISSSFPILGTNGGFRGVDSALAGLVAWCIFPWDVDLHTYCCTGLEHHCVGFSLLVTRSPTNRLVQLDFFGCPFFFFFLTSLPPFPVSNIVC
ncbi:hypothetical protein F5Y17DRAFT_452291 [Xylariaceae sp. FL0594]|nr:hypothetical protein F5Y17DRAFT_452291 [Xylariaceae sp. FL0594]